MSATFKKQNLYNKIGMQTNTFSLMYEVLKLRYKIQQVHKRKKQYLFLGKSENIDFTQDTRLELGRSRE